MSTLKVSYASDLHLEFGPLDITNTDRSDVLILAGDIFLARDLHDHPPGDVALSPAILETLGSRQRLAYQYRSFLRQVSSEFEHVVYVPGNHEFYHNGWTKTYQHLRDEVSQYKNILLGHRSRFMIRGVRFLATTLWTDLDRGNHLAMLQAEQGLNDYRVIRVDSGGYRRLRASDVLSEFTLSRDWLATELATSAPTVVVTHHAPTYASISNEYVGDSLNHCYASDLGEFILDHPIHYWVHGHVHCDNDYTVGNTRVLSNPRGYAGWEARASDWTLRSFTVEY